LAASGIPVIGINWEGNRSDSLKKDRNIELDQLRQIIEAQNIAVVSLQRGTNKMKEFPAWLKEKFTEHQTQIHILADSNDSSDFHEYASVVNSCDLVITTATTVAHLAAGMGTLTWIMLQKSPDWRWGLNGSKTFWYQSARLFRQKTYGDWVEPLAEIHRELQYFLKSEKDMEGRYAQHYKK